MCPGLFISQIAFQKALGDKKRMICPSHIPHDRLEMDGGSEKEFAFATLKAAFLMKDPEKIFRRLVI